jgi:hypothetical protein
MRPAAAEDPGPNAPGNATDPESAGDLEEGAERTI